MEMGGKFHANVALPRRTQPLVPTVQEAGWVSRVGLCVVEKSLFHLPGIDLRVLSRPAEILVSTPAQGRTKQPSVVNDIESRARYMCNTSQRARKNSEN
jgi:hypothetical protein